MRYTYPAIIEKNENNQFNITFPDIQGCYTCSNSETQVIQDAKEILLLHINSKTKRNNPSQVETLQSKIQNSNLKIILVEVFINE